MPLVPGLADHLDQDGDQSVDEGEFFGLAELGPHIDLDLRLGTAGEQPTGLWVKALAPEVAPYAPTPSEGTTDMTFVLPGAKLRLFVRDPAADYREVAKAQLAALDADSNGYLEKEELPENAFAQGGSFDEIDADKNGKLYPDEIAAFAERQQAEQLRQVRASVGGTGDSLFAALDETNDGRLGLREMRFAAERLVRMDRDEDGQVSMAEVPAAISVTFARGPAEANQAQTAAAPVQAMAAAPPPAGPTWFVRMDSNGDGDVSPREFLGSPDQFRDLDADADGFLQLAEATSESGGQEP
jgi:hypothetical protein